MKSNSLERKHELIATSFISQYSSMLFVTKAVLILEQFSKCKFVVLLGINDTFSSKLNVSSYMTLQIWLNILKIFITLYFYIFFTVFILYEKYSGQVVLVIVFTTKHFEMRKVLKINVLIGHMLGIMVKKWGQGKVLSFMQVLLHTMI